MSLNIGNVFGASFYRAANSDLACLNDAQVLSHFQTFDLYEGHRFSTLINLNFYLVRNFDLASFINGQLLGYVCKLNIVKNYYKKVTSCEK